MGHTGIARLCLAHWDYRTRTELAEKVREAPASIGRGGCHNSHHPDPNDPEEHDMSMDDQFPDGMFRFEKVMSNKEVGI